MNRKKRFRSFGCMVILFLLGFLTLSLFDSWFEPLKGKSGMNDEAATGIMEALESFSEDSAFPIQEPSESLEQTVNSDLESQGNPEGGTAGNEGT